MSPQEGTAWQVGADASEVLGPESSVFAQVDPVDFGSSVLSVLGRAAGHPDEVGGAWLRFGAAVAEAGPAAVARWLGSNREPPVPVDDRDKRFADAAWDGNPGWFALRQAYLAARRLGEDLLAAGRGDPVTDQKAQARRRPGLRRPGPDQLPAHQPGRAEAGVRDRRRQRGRRVPELPRRPRAQPRAAAPGRHLSVRAGPQPRGDPREGGVPQRADGADPVRAADQAGALGTAAGQPALDQQVLRHGPGPGAELPRVGGAAPAHGVRDLLPQPGRLDERRHPGRLPHPRPEDGARRHRRHHRLTQDRHRRAVPRRRADRDARRLPDRDGRRPDRLDHAAQHPARLQRARRARRLRRRADHRPAGRADGPDRGHGGLARWPARSTCCGPTT